VTSTASSSAKVIPAVAVAVRRDVPLELDGRVVVGTGAKQLLRADLDVERAPLRPSGRAAQRAAASFGTAETSKPRRNDQANC
jgi:hypothetical protein